MNKDDKDAYIEQLEKENAELKRRIEELERRLGMNSQNSSRPPSTDLPTTARKPLKGRRKKRGAEKGHEPHLRELLPPEQVSHRIELKPQACTCGSERLGPCDQEPLRHQVIDIPAIVPDVTEYLQHVCQCKDCGAFVYAPLPDEVKRTHFGPGVLSMIGILTGDRNVSKRKALVMMNDVFSVPMSLGGLSNCEGQLTDVFEQPYQEAIDHARVQEIGHADETGWPRGNRQRGWLWPLCCTTAAVFMVHAKRGQEAGCALLGEFSGTLISDRWGGYNFFSGMRQICWAHLKRDFKAISEARGVLGKIGQELHGLAKTLLKLRGRVRDGTL
ncbi:MAG TPA: IS66 family transposase, partial [Gammaproteobacteria bacterium]|nr:IS66 family transposase [Gammaproteobacteria bacterium]